MKKISLVVQDGGGGHRVSAQALAAVMADQCPTWSADRVDLYRDILNLPIAYGYNFILRLGWTGLFWPVTVPWFRWHRRLRRRAWLAKLQQYWRQQQPDLVVSLIPFVNRELYHSLQTVRSGAPFVIVLTDLATEPPNFWLDPWQGESNLFVICPTPKAMEQALALGYPKTQLFETSGVILHPRFYQPIRPVQKPDWAGVSSESSISSTQTPCRPPTASSKSSFIPFDRGQARQRLGLDPDLTTGVLLFGGQGDNIMLQIAQRLDASALPLQLILLCGKNQSLVNQLRRYAHRHPWVVEGFLDNVPDYLSLADFLIGKPGPASLSEAIALNLPVITVCNRSTLWHERYNAQWIAEQKLGIVLPNFRGIDQAVKTLMQPETLARYQANTEAIVNRAIFEVVDIFQEILQKTLQETLNHD